ncbi:hypothetical protein FHS96_003078 [Sphingomonas zeicaulis]|uniref:phage tail sheath subtilisin-like domain-containing protein n=1 Tax=Sphingomonas zeicaulis TaxID=1632740 RepID=UPI003D25BCA5
MPVRHGIFVNEPVEGAREIVQVASGVIGLVATGSDADATLFPLNKPVLITDVRAALGEAGAAGTLGDALEAIANQASPIIVVIRVAEGVDAAATTTNVIGATTGGDYTGIQALLAAEAQIGVRPRILGAPGLDVQAVTEAMTIAAKRLRGFVYAGCDDADTVTEAVTYRGEFGDRELMLLYPDFSGFAGQAVAVALGTRARIDEETGWHKTLSNVAVKGVSGMSKDVFFDLQDATTDAGVLNNAPVTTMIRHNGYRFWGNRTCSDEPKFAFESAVRTSQVLRDSIASGLIWAVDKPITKGLATDMLDTINAEFRSLQAQGRLIGAKAWLDPTLNPAGNLAAGKIVIDYDFTPCAPAEDIGLNQRITDRYYSSLTEV